MSDDIRTLAEHRASAEQTGEWISTDVDFSNDGERWARFLLPTEEHPHPLLARATVVRKGKDDAVQTVLIWDEAVPDDGFEVVWEQRPHLLFGAAVERAALRRAFPSALAGLAAADRTPWTAPAAPEPEVAWEQQIADAVDVPAVDAVHAAMKAVRAVTPALEVALKARRRTLTAEPIPAGTALDSLTPGTTARASTPEPSAAPKRSRAKASGS